MRAPERSPAAWPRVSDYAVEPESGQEMACSDLALLKRWTVRAAYVARASSLFLDD
jgi:hypothetical protein